NSTTGYHLRWPKKNSTHCPGWVDHYTTTKTKLKELAGGGSESAILENLINKAHKAKLRMEQTPGGGRSKHYKWIVIRRLKTFSP
ncbi:hypothetical protein, partial [Pseudomonas aeruginosa]|nr:hypothetical protein [Pseudomonas aeruginosa]